MSRIADTRWKHYPWDEERPSGQYVAPFGTQEYAECTAAIDSITAPEVELQSIQCPLPQVDLWPARYGYARTQPGIREILSAARLYPDMSRSLSGTEAGYTGSPRNALTWTGANGLG